MRAIGVKKLAWWEDGAVETTHEGNKEIRPQEETQTEMGFSRGTPDSPARVEMTRFAWWLEGNADFIDFATEWVTRVGNPRKYVREWKICK